jgi:hypothetical protein
LVGERVRNPSGQQIRKIIGKSHVAANWRMKPGYLYTVVRAISARVNQNFDGWPSHELKEAAHTFVGKPVFVNHENFNPEKARGVVVAARYIENGRDKYIETVMEIDAKRFPILAKEIKEGGLDSVSMGAEAGFTICSACGNKAYDEPDMCDHVKFHKGQTIRVRNRKTGKIEDKLVFESCHKLSFFELSYVFDPADETAVASKVVVGAKHVHSDTCQPGQPCWGTRMHNDKAEIGGGGSAIAGGSPAVLGQPAGNQTQKPGAPAATAGGGAPSKDLTEALTRAGIDPAMHPLISGFAVAEGNNPSGAPTLGFTDSQAGTSLDSHAQALSKQIKDRASVSGEFPKAGTPEQQASWMATTVGQNGVQSDWQGNAQPARSDYVNSIVKNMPAAAPATATTTTMAPTATPPSAPAPSTTTTSSPAADANKATTAMVRQAVLKRLAGHSEPTRIPVSLKERIAMAVYQKVAFGEVEAPPEVDTLREEGTAPEDDNDDFHHYVDAPQELSMPDLSDAARLDRAQDENDQQAMDTGTPGPNSPEGGPPPAGDPGVQGDEGQYMTLKIPVPQPQPAAPAGPPAPASPQMPMQTFGSKQLLSWFDRYYGYRVARDVTLENVAADSPTSRNSVKGTANMARSTLATRRATAGTRHFAEGPLTDGGDKSRNDEGEQEEAFITQVPAEDSTPLPDEDTSNISNTEGNLVADEAYAHSLTARMRSQQASLEATAREYKLALAQGLIKRANGDAGGPTATEVNPEVPTPSAEQLTGDDFDSADPNPSIDTSVAGPGTTTLPIESSLQAFRAFDKWLTAGTRKSARHHSESNIRKAAKQFADYNGISVQAMFPALGIALREARKVEAAKKSQSKKVSNVRKQAVDLETAAPDERISVPTPVSNTTDAEAQASQFDESGWDNNAGKDITDPDLSTGQNFAPGQAPKTSKKADGILAIRCAEAMIAAGLEPNTRERKYQLAGEYSQMSRGLILDRTAMAEKFAMVRQADRQQMKVASGSTRGAVSSPIPAGLGQGGSMRQASVQRSAANQNNPENDALLFG